jgi:ABC-2 type transport system permease protein
MSATASLTRESFLFAGRGLRHVRRVPERLLDVTVQPVIFVLLFAFVFGSAIAVPGGGSYREFLVSGMLAQTVTFASASMAVGVANDMREGVIDRFRSLPIARISVLAGRTIAEIAQNLLGVAVTAVTGFAIGWRIHNGVLGALGALGVLLAFGFALSWTGTLIGLLVRSPEAAQGVFFITLFPLTFASGVFVPTANMTPWLRDFANWNPVTALATSVRGLLGNPTAASDSWPLQHATLVSLGWSALFLVIFAPLAVRLYVRRVTR